MLYRLIISLYNTILNFGTFYPGYGTLKFMMVLVKIDNCNHWRIQIRLKWCFSGSTPSNIDINRSETVDHAKLCVVSFMRR